MRIRDLFGRSRPVFSFEFFPPKTDAGAENLMRTVADLEDALDPDFVSVTYGAGGSTRSRTLEVVTRIQAELGTTTMAHLTCVGSTREEIAEVAKTLHKAGIQNVLGLRGDPPQGEDVFRPVPGGFPHASDLIEFLTDQTELCVGAACYPESHTESKSLDQDLFWTRKKVECGADFLVSQLFFDNQRYFDFVERARRSGIDVPIVPGIMPVSNVAQVERFTKMCGATIPQELLERLRRDQDDPALVMATGIEWAIRQCRDLLERGAPGIHFYTLNKSHATRSIAAAI